MPGAFEASPEFDHDELRTAEEIQRCGAEVLAWLEALATSVRSRAVDSALVDDIHRRWFETTFPSDAGHHRRAMVLNRKATAVPYESILPAIANACENWAWRRENAAPVDSADFVAFVVAEANTLTVTRLRRPSLHRRQHADDVAPAQLPAHARRSEAARRAPRRARLPRRVVGGEPA